MGSTPENSPARPRAAPDGFDPALAPLLTGRPVPGIYVAAGPRLLPSWFLSALCPALEHGTSLFWIDAGNAFDAYGVSYAARALGFDPKAVLRQVRLARPFNLFQLETMVRRKLPALWRGEPVVLSDPFPLFYDEDVSVEDARRVFASVLEGFKALPAVWMVLAVEREAPEGRAGWFEELVGRASGLAVLRGAERDWRLEKSERDHG